MAVCARTGKRRFTDKVAALCALSKVGKGHAGLRAPKEPIRAYRCPYCRGWHLTSQPLERGGRSPRD